MNFESIAAVDSIRDVEQLEEMLSTPTEGVVATLSRLEGDVIILGVGGKMGPTLARMVRRGTDLAGRKRRVIGVARFTATGLEQRLRSQGIETIACDLLDPAQLQQLPDVPNVVFMAGRKFGATGNESLTWAMNAFLPGIAACKFDGSRIVAFSTGNVYPLTNPNGGGSAENDPPGPVGEYAMSCLGRERILEHFGRTMSTPMALLRLNYAVEMRYGVLLDVARRVWAGEAIDVTMGSANVIWQGDATAMAIQAFDYARVPAFVVNVAGPEILSIRRVAQQFGQWMGKQVTFTGTESPTALLSNGQLGHRLFGYPRTPVQQVIRWVADWVKRGGETLDKPTHFEVRDGKF